MKLLVSDRISTIVKIEIARIMHIIWASHLSGRRHGIGRCPVHGSPGTKDKEKDFNYARMGSLEGQQRSREFMPWW